MTRGYVPSGRYSQCSAAAPERRGGESLARAGLPQGGLLAPRGTPEPILDRLNAELNAVIREPDIVERIRSFGAVPAGGDRAAYGRVLEADWARWGQVVRENDIRAG